VSAEEQERLKAERKQGESISIHVSWQLQVAHVEMNVCMTIWRWRLLSWFLEQSS